MEAKEGWTISQAAKALGKSQKTIRRMVKAGQLSNTLVHGKYGPEYRITELPIDKVKAEPPTPNLALEIISRLQEENRNMAGQLGAARQVIINLESQVKLLTEAKKPWYYKLTSLFRKE